MRVKDNTGGHPLGVTVVLTSTDTGQTRETLSDDSGYYVFNNLRVGNYEVKADLEGFQPVRVTGIKLSVGERLNVPLILNVSEVTTEVEVRAEVEQVETTTSQLDTIIDEKRILDLPLNGRNPLNLIYLTPGVIQGQSGYASANGGRERGNNYQIDGIDNNYTQTVGSTVDVNVDATSEFRVVTSNPSAEYGRAGGAVIDLAGPTSSTARPSTSCAPRTSTRRSGRRTATAWRRATTSAFSTALHRRSHHQGQAFFFNTELLRIRQMTVVTGFTPYQAFRDSVTNPDIAQIFNTPTTRCPTATRKPTSAAAMSGRTPSRRTSNSTWPRWTTTSTRPTPSPSATSATPAPTRTPPPRAAAICPRSRTPGSTRHGPDLRRRVDLHRESHHGQLLKLGYPAPPTPGPASGRTIDLNFGGYLQDPTRYFTDFGGPWRWGQRTRPQHLPGQGHRHLDPGHPQHQVRRRPALEPEQRRLGFGMTPTAFFDGAFNGGDTVDNMRAVVDNVDHAVYSDGTVFSRDISDWRGWRQKEFDFFVQDDWKVFPNFTVNLGLRYEYKPAALEVNNMAANVMDPCIQGYHIVNQNDFFDPANWVDGEWWNLVPSQWVGTGADIFLAGPDTGNDLYEASTSNWAPRLGFSWDPFGDGKTAIRGGYGVSFDRMFGNLLTWNAAQLPFGVENFLSAQPGAGYDGVYPDNVGFYGSGIPMPEVTLHLAPESFYEMVLYNNDLKTPYIQTWNLSAQRELWPGNILNLTYAGSAGVHLYVRNNPNQMPHPSEATIQGMVDNGLGSTSIPWYVRYYSGMNSQFVRVHNIDSYGHSNYHSLQTSYSHRFQDGLQFQANYTWSAAFDNNSSPCGRWATPARSRPDWYNLDYDQADMPPSTCATSSAATSSTNSPSVPASGWAALRKAGWPSSSAAGRSTGSSRPTAASRWTTRSRATPWAPATPTTAPRPDPMWSRTRRAPTSPTTSLAPPRPTSPGPPASSTCTTRLVITTAASSAAPASGTSISPCSRTSSCRGSPRRVPSCSSGPRRSTCSTTPISTTPIPT